MAIPPRDGLAMRDFPGFVDNEDPLDQPPGTGQVQVNVMSRSSGQLMVRRGLAVLSFEAEGYVADTPPGGY